MIHLCLAPDQNGSLWLFKKRKEGSEERWVAGVKVERRKKKVKQEGIASSPTSCWLIRSCWAASPESCMHAGLTHPQAHTCDSSESRTRSLPLLFDAIKGTQFVSSVIALVTVPWDALKEWFCGLEDVQHNKKISYLHHFKVTNISEIKLATNIFYSFVHPVCIWQVIWLWSLT